MTVRSQSEAVQVAASGFEAVYGPVKPHLEALDAFLLEQVDALEPEIRPQVRYVFGHSGKRLRPILVAYSGWQGPAADGEATRVRLSAVIELVHLATLVHDDILDGADMRHRQETAAAKYGPSAAVLIGDALFAHALHLAAGFPTTEVCREVAAATARVCAGEISQTYRRGAVDTDKDRYFRIIELKTAELFEVSCRLSARLSGYPDAFAAAAGQFGRRLGRAYQIFDDLVDLYATEDMIGKTLGTDLDKGKFTLPLLLVLEKVDPAERASLLEGFDNGAADTAERFAAHLRALPVFEEVRDCFEAEVQAAEDALAPHGDLPAQARLLQFCGLIRGQLERVAERV